MEGTVVGGYTITTFLAEGGMGAVWLAEHGVMGRGAVVKLLHAELGRDPVVVERFLNEARAAASIDDPGIVQVFDVGHLPDGRAYIVMERLIGETLAARLGGRDDGGGTPLGVAATVTILKLIVRTLGAAHARGIVHRDLKPDNIFLVRDPDVAGGERTKILDFGIAKLATGQTSVATRAGSMFGTPAYMAPEQCEDAASVDARADLYAVGCIAYELLTGRPPFGLGGLEVIAAQLRDEPVPLREHDPSIPTALEALVARLLRKRPDERPASATELYAALDALVLAPGAAAAASATAVTRSTPPAVGSAPTLAAEPGPAAAATTLGGASGALLAAAEPARSRRPVLVALIVLAAGLVAGGAVLVMTGGRAGPAATAPGAPDAALLAPVDATLAVLDAEPLLVLDAAPMIVDDAALAVVPPDAARIGTVRDAGSPPLLTDAAPAVVVPPPVDAAAPPVDAAPPPADAPAVEVPAVVDASVPVDAPEAPPTEAPPPPRKPRVTWVDAGPIWDNRDARKKCPPLCPAPATWKGTWTTTVRGKMSRCGCVAP